MARKGSTRIKKAERPPVDPVVEKARAIGVPEAQIARGHLAIVDVKLVERERAETFSTVMNRGGTAVERWYGAKQLTPVQMRAIEYVQALWFRVGGPRGLVADLARIPGMPGGDGLSQQEALDNLARFKRLTPPRYWPVFENVCRYDVPAAQAGRGLDTDSRGCASSARLCVRFVADLIVMWTGLTA